MEGPCASTHSRRTHMRSLPLAAALACAATMVAAPSAMADTTVTVNSKDSGNGWYSGDTRPPGTGTFETGPATPPLGNGGFELSTSDSTAKVQLLTDAYDGVALGSIDGVGYSTYRDPASTGFEAEIG